MNIEQMTYGEFKQIAALFQSPVLQNQHFFEIGKNYIVRTVTMIYTGKLVDVGATEIVLIDAAWIPETDRFMQFVSDGKIKECEPYPDGKRVIIGRGGLMDAFAVEWELPRRQK